MKKLLLSLAVAAAIMAPTSLSYAADLEPPPPVDDLRPASYDWTGPYVGVYGMGIGVDGYFDGTCSCGATYTNIEHSGIGFGGGILAGVNWQWDNIVVGLEGDWGMGTNVASNYEPGIHTDLLFNQIGTARTRAGWANGNTLLYLTGGLAVVDAEFQAMMASSASDNAWIFGWTAGGGIETAVTDSLHVRLEYLYMGLPDTSFSLTDNVGTTLDATQHFNDVQMVRAGVTYNFTW